MNGTPRPSPWKIWLPIIAGVSAFVALSIYAVRESHEVGALDISGFQWHLVALIFATRALFQLANGFSLKAFSAHFGIDLDFVEWAGLSVTTSLANLFLPASAGMVTRAAYLRVRFQFPITRFVSIAAASYIVIVFVSVIVTGVLVLLSPISFGGAFWPLVCILAVLGCGSLFIMVVPISWRSNRQSRIFRHLDSVLDGWERLRNDPGVIMKQMAIVLVNQFSQGAELYIALRALNQPTTFWQAMTITELTSTSTLVRLTPGNIGVVELLAGVFAAIAQASSISVVSAYILIRLVGLMIILATGPVFSYFLTKRLAATE